MSPADVGRHLSSERLSLRWKPASSIYFYANVTPRDTRLREIFGGKKFLAADVAPFCSTRVPGPRPRSGDMPDSFLRRGRFSPLSVGTVTLIGEGAQRSRSLPKRRPNARRCSTLSR
jgi:hypothetical protein